MNESTDLVHTLGWIAKRYGVWIVLGLMALEIGLAFRRGEL